MGMAKMPNFQKNPPAWLCRGGGMPRCAKFHTQEWRGERLPLEGGAPRSESKIYMTAGGSHTATTLAARQG